MLKDRILIKVLKIKMMEAKIALFDYCKVEKAKLRQTWLDS